MSKWRHRIANLLFGAGPPPLIRIDAAHADDKNPYLRFESHREDGPPVTTSPDQYVPEVPPDAPVSPSTSSSRHMFDAGEMPPPNYLDPEVCPHCGRPMPTVGDYLRESLALIGDQGNEIVRAFYRDLLDEAPGLAEIFPADLLGDDARGQRDKLLRALVALATSYEPRDREAMARLDTALGVYGRSHSAFRRHDGSMFGPARIEDYILVKRVLFSTLHTAAGAAWKPEYDDAWIEAYDFAAIRMMNAALDSPESFGRMPRPAQ